MELKYPEKGLHKPLLKKKSILQDDYKIAVKKGLWKRINGGLNDILIDSYKTYLGSDNL